MKSAARRWILPLLRYGLCAVAIWYLYTVIPWYDYVHLADAGETRVRLVEQRADGCVVVQDGQQRFIPDSGILHIVDENGQRIRKIEYGISGVIPNVKPRLALLAILLFLPVSLLSAMRLVWMLAIQEVRLSYWIAVKLTYAGNFFNFALPGTTGGDLIKAYYITRFTQHKTEAVTTVFLDRVVGLLGLVALAGVMILVSIVTDPGNERRFGQLGLVLGVVCLGLAAGALLVFSKRLRHAIGLPALAARLPAGEHLLRIGRAVVKMRHHKGLVAAALFNTIVLQFIVMVSAYTMALAIGMKNDFEKYLIYVPIGFLIAAIPIAPPQGFGVMEAAYIQFFAHTGMSTISQAFTFALAVRVIQLVWALPGVLVPLLGAHIPTQRELAELEAPDDEASPPPDIRPVPPAADDAAPATREPTGPPRRVTAGPAACEPRA
jgi:uncharacterized protein (TIRG00374 family)